MRDMEGVTLVRISESSRPGFEPDIDNVPQEFF